MKNYFDLSENVIIITGASGKLGSQYSMALSSYGANVVLADINTRKSIELEKKIKKEFNTKPLTIGVDIANVDSIKNLVWSTVKKFGKIDTLINNAVFEPNSSDFHKPVESFEVDSWNKVLQVNLTGTFLCCKEIGRQMVKQKRGNIINISSIYGLVGADQRIYGKSKINSSIAYAATKAATLNLTRYLASYWHDKGIRVNTLTLGGVYARQPKYFLKNYSSRTMLGRMALQDEYNGAIIFLCSNASSYMTGSNLIIDGGWTAW